MGVFFIIASMAMDFQYFMKKKTGRSVPAGFEI
jgi:hypothetical protein